MWIFRRRLALPFAFGALLLTTALSGCGDDCHQRTGDGICLDHMSNSTAAK